MATFAKVFNSTSSMLKYRNAKCPAAMEATIARFLGRGWRRWSDITKCRFTGHRVTLGIDNTYSVRRVTICEDGSVSYEGRDMKTTYIQNENVELLKRIMSTGVDIKKAKEILAAMKRI